MAKIEVGSVIVNKRSGERVGIIVKLSTEPEDIAKDQAVYVLWHDDYTTTKLAGSLLHYRLFHNEWSLFNADDGEPSNA